MHIVIWKAIKIQCLNKTYGKNYEPEILKEKRKVNNDTDNNNKIIIMVIIKKKLKLFHFDNYVLAMTLLSKDFVHQIF